ncbi:MAG: alpha/beta hydrolase, partial [Pseudomonadota bacterium]
MTLKRALIAALLLAACETNPAPPPVSVPEEEANMPSPPVAPEEQPIGISPIAPEESAEMDGSELGGSRGISPPPLPSTPVTGTIEVPASRSTESFQADSNGCTKLLAAGYDGFTCVSLFYGTNRAPTTYQGPIRSRRQDIATDEGDLFSIRPDRRKNCEPNSRDYSETRDSTRVCHLGEVVVSIPDTRRRLLQAGGGAFDAARSGEALSLNELRKEFALLDHTSYDSDQAAFATRVQQIIRNSAPDDRHAFVYIHGFNVPFRNAAFRTAQLKYDMQIDAPVFFFSWPSNGSLLDYLSDQEDADLSVDALARYLRFVHETVRAGDPEMKLHIVAHSMGTRVTSQALARLSDFEDAPDFGHIVFAAGDLDSNLFEEWMGAAARVYQGVTLYTSNQDAAIGFSGTLRNLSNNLKFWGEPNDDIKLRIGFYKDSGQPAAFDMRDAQDRNIVRTIDVSEAARKSSFLFSVKHSTYAESRIITDDIRCLF